MPAASASPAFRSAAHRRAVMQHIGATIVPSALAFAVFAPLIGLALIWGSTFVALVCSVITGGVFIGSAIQMTLNAVVSTYAASAMAAGIAGVWAALLSPFAPDNARFYSGAAIVGMMNAFLFVSVDGRVSGMFGGPLFIAVAGAVSVFLCARLFKDIVLKRNEAQRDTMARERAERLAKERADASGR